MANRRVGLWLVGAFGGVGSTAALGLAALQRGLTDTTSLVTALPLFEGVDLDPFAAFVVGGHDIRRGGFRQSVRDLHERANVFPAALLDACGADLDAWSANVRTGTTRNCGPAIEELADVDGSRAEPRSLGGLVEQFRRDLKEFREKHRLDQVVVVNVASTEPPPEPGPELESLEAFEAALHDAAAPPIPASALYAYAALDLGLPYVNFTPSLGSACPALEELAVRRKALTCGRDGKTGETLMKSVLAPMFAHRNWRLLSWVGHNIFGNRDGQVLNDPANKASKVRTKDAVISGVVGYKPQTLVTIEYIESMDDWKTAWNHIHFQGFLGTKMVLQFIWQGCDSLLAAPLVLDLARLTLLAQRRGESGVLTHLTCFFKNPMGTGEHDFFRQFEWLEGYARKASAGQ
jgi:myo-inositol-1-phosphate synthase